MISIENLAVEFSARPLFHDVSFVINDRDRIALVGKNGAGKSTMLKILCGQQKPTSGTVAIPNDTTIGYLPQVMKLADDTTVIEEARKAFIHTTRMKERIERLQQEMADRTDYESESYAQLVEKFTLEHDRYMMLGGDNYEATLERTLTGLGFQRSDFDRPTREFSGGWRMRIELAKILLQQPDVLLLDEPTNHLDIESIQWLEQFLAQSAKAVVLVSHDRAFINNVTNRTIEITCGHIEDYKVKYDQYVVLRAERREQHAAEVVDGELCRTPLALERRADPVIEIAAHQQPEGSRVRRQKAEGQQPPELPLLEPRPAEAENGVKGASVKRGEQGEQIEGDVADDDVEHQVRNAEVRMQHAEAVDAAAQRIQGRSLRS